ncbi:MAG: preprotein translocase subunit YajC [Bdellovibrionales bacterium]|jgi:preprotein translocase subunit YajC|nr:preprotein translocase subunit YajC [Bdellovibrionales bacterium]MBT3525790.1 preprotein translocase subunit YajC [Bdellovibrionales bacterium]MBT7668798.1 preprotein translocase subunit YajC [Bdellovibrionales bacterium]MBT7765966.1 preprotein translocase subunit YajC [Bdellovibrionales bacterium]
MLDLLIGNAYAQGTAAAQTPNPLVSFAPFVVIFIIFYFLMIRPQKKKMEQEQQMLNALNKGDEVYTKSGLLGTVSGLTEKIVTLEIAEGVKVKVLKHQVAGFAKALFEKREEGKKPLPATK